MDNNNYYKIVEAPLEPKERKKLRYGMMVMPFFLVFLGGFAYFMFEVMDMSTDDVFFIFFLAFMLIFLGVIIYVSRSIILDLNSGMKQVLQGIITRKKHEVVRRKKGASKHYYYVHFDDYVLSVESNQYDGVTEGDLVEFHFAKHSSVVFSYAVLKKNALAELKMKGIELHEPKSIDKEWPVSRTIAIVAVIVPLFFLGIFWVVADCFNCGSEYPASIEQWPKYESVYNGSDSSRIYVEDVLLSMNDTLLDQEEMEIINTFQMMASKRQVGDLISGLESIVVGDSITGRIWLRTKFDEDNPVSRLSVMDIARSTLFAITGSSTFRPTTKLRPNDFHIWDLNRAILSDIELSYDHIKTWFGQDRSIREMQYVISNYLPKDTSEYSPGVNRLFKEVLSHPNRMNASDRSGYERSVKKYGL